VTTVDAKRGYSVDCDRYGPVTVLNHCCGIV